MTEQQFNKLVEFLKKNHPELFNIFHASIVGDINGVAVIRPADVSDEDFDRINEIITDWTDKNIAKED